MLPLFLKTLQKVHNKACVTVLTPLGCQIATKDMKILQHMEDYRRRDASENSCCCTDISLLKTGLQARSFQDETFGKKQKQKKTKSHVANLM